MENYISQYKFLIHILSGFKLFMDILTNYWFSLKLDTFFCEMIRRRNLCQIIFFPLVSKYRYFYYRGLTHLFFGCLCSHIHTNIYTNDNNHYINLNVVATCNVSAKVALAKKCVLRMMNMMVCGSKMPKKNEGGG